MRYTGPKARLCRREGVNLFGTQKYQKILNKNSNIPGIHGGKRLAKLTEYAKQLRAKQVAKRVFGLSEKQFKNYFDKATSSKVVTGDMLLQLLERRLDNVLYRSGIALTRQQARQFVSHGLFLLNGKSVDIPSIQVSIGDKIEIKESKKKSKVFSVNKELLEKDFIRSSWLNVNPESLSVEVSGIPGIKDFESIIYPQLIVEFYSR